MERHAHQGCCMFQKCTEVPCRSWSMNRLHQNHLGCLLQCTPKSDSLGLGFGTNKHPEVILTHMGSEI